MQAGLDEIFTRATDARRARFRCNFLYYDWTGLRQKCQRQRANRVAAADMATLSDHAPLSAEIHL